jgi:short-subunit dehydrogenase involved in D-alanine esterification of teichoic acids
VIVTTLSDPTQSANVLITGGSDGIGRGLAVRYLATGAKVLVTGRNAEKLEKASRELPGILTFVPTFPESKRGRRWRAMFNRICRVSTS